jgi:hypothetical protein
MTGPKVASSLEANTPGTDRTPPTDILPLREGITRGNSQDPSLIKPPIFRRFWSTGLLYPQDLQALQGQNWIRGIAETRGCFDVGNDLCVLASGLAARHRASDAGGKQSTALVLPGDICDYSVITSTEPRTKPVALAKSSYLRISPEQALHWQKIRPMFLRLFSLNWRSIRPCWRNCCSQSPGGRH